MFPGAGADAPGSERFVEGLLSHLQDKQALTEIPRAQRFVGRPTLSHLFPAQLRANRAKRDAIIRQAHLDHGTACPKSAERRGCTIGP